MAEFTPEFKNSLQLAEAKPYIKFLNARQNLG